MNPDPPNVAAEIEALIEVLHDTEQKLARLTAGEVDAVANRAGRTLLLKEAQEDLRLLEADKRSSILDALPACIALLDAEGCILSVNAAWRSYAYVCTPRRAGHEVGLNYLDLCDLSDEPTAAESQSVALGARAVLSGATNTFSIEYSCRAGVEKRWFLLSVTPLVSDRPNGAIVMCLDITERQLATEAMDRSTALLQGVVTGTTDHVFVKDIAGRYLICNEAFASFACLPVEQIIGRTNDAVFGLVDPQNLVDIDRAVVESGVSHTNETAVRVGQSWRTVLTTRSPYRDGRGKTLGIIGISRDISDRKQEEEERERERQLLRTLIDSLPDVIYSKDALGRFVICNRAAVAHFGCDDEQQLVGKTSFDLVPHAVATSIQADDLRVLAGESVVDREERRVAPDGAVEWSQTIKVPLRGAAGQVQGLVRFSRNITQFKRAELRLFESQSLLTVAGQMARVGGWSVDLPPTRVTWSDVVSLIHDELPGFSPSIEQALDYYVPEHLEMMREAFDACVRDGIPFDVEHQIISAKGRRLWVRAIGQAIRDDDGTISRVQGALQDLTERKKAEHEARRLTLRLADTLENIADGYFSVDRHWRYTYLNSEAERMIRQSSDALLGRTLWDAFPYLVGTVFEDHYRRAMDGEIGVAFDAQFTSRNIWISVNCYPTDEGLSVYFRDITAARLARRHLELLEASVSQLNDMVVITEGDPRAIPEPRIVFVNDAFVSITGLARDVVIGQSPRLLLYGPDSDDGENQRISYLLGRLQPVHAELLKTRADGTRYWIDMDATPIAFAGEGFSHYVTVARDITERKRDQDALREMNVDLEARVAARTAELDVARELAEDANRAKSSFLATMSHEIRTPMNGVIGMIDVLEQTSLAASQAEIVKTVRESAHALLGIVDDVLDFSKIEAGQFQIDTLPMNVATVVEGACDTLDHLAASKGVTLLLFTDPTIPATTLGDAARLRQVLLNLASNAIKFSSGLDRPGQVFVRAVLVSRTAEQVSVEIGVIDNGIGMDDQTQTCLFRPFTQADAGTTRRFGGTGLGLSISHRLVAMMEGRISVASRVDQGSTFTVHLDLTPLPDEGPVDAEALLVRGLDCVVIGSTPYRGGDLARYLEHAGAHAEHLPDTSAVVAWLEATLTTTCVVVIAGTQESVEEMLAICRAACHLLPLLDVRFLLIERGRRRRPRAGTTDVISLDGEAMHRSTFLRAVAIAARRAPGDADPTVQPTGPVRLAPATSSAEPDSNGLVRSLLLIAEDNEINQRVLRQQLDLLGLDSEVVGNGREALDRAIEGDYAMLLTDLHMPVMDGYALATALRQVEAEAGRPRMPIVALSANAMAGEVKRCRDAGMDDYMTKPVQLKHLRNMLAKWLPATAFGATDLVLPESHEEALPRQAIAAAMPADLSALVALVGSEPNIIAEMVAAFRRSAARSGSEIRAGIANGQIDAVADAAHMLKSGARSIGALRLGDICASLEAAVETGNPEVLQTLLPDFDSEMLALDRYLEATRKDVARHDDASLPIDA